MSVLPLEAVRTRRARAGPGVEWVREGRAFYIVTALLGVAMFFLTLLSLLGMAQVLWLR